MSNLLHESKQQQVVALGRLGWSLRKIEAATGVRRETISGYLAAAGVPVRRARGRLAAGKSGHHGGGVHRLGATGCPGDGRGAGSTGARPRPDGERVRALS